MHCYAIMIVIQVINDHSSFKDAELETNQPIEFLTDEVTFGLSKPSPNWKINKLNSPVVHSLHCYQYKV